MSNIVKYPLYVLAFSPILAFFILLYLDRAPNWFLGAVYSFISVVFLAEVALKSKKIVIPFYLKLLILLFLYYLGWGIYTNFIHYNGFFGFLYKNTVLFSIFILLMVENAHFDREFIDRMIFIFKITIIISFAISMIQVFVIPFFLIPSFLQGERSEFGLIRFPSMFSYIGVNELGFSFLPIVCLLIGYDMYYRKRPNIILIGLSGVVAILSSSRYIQLGFFLLLLQLVFRKKVILRNLAYTAVFILIFVATLSFISHFLGFDVMDYYYSRIRETTYMSRVIGFQLFLKFFPQNPIFGTGERVTHELSFELGRASPYIHIGYLSHLYEFGIVGSIFLFGAWLSIAYVLLRSALRTQFFGSFFGFLMFLFTNATLVEYNLFHYGIVFTLVFQRYFSIYATQPAVTTPASVRSSIWNDKVAAYIASIRKYGVARVTRRGREGEGI